MAKCGVVAAISPNIQDGRPRGSSDEPCAAWSTDPTRSVPVSGYSRSGRHRGACTKKFVSVTCEVRATTDL